MTGTTITNVTGLLTATSPKIPRHTKPVCNEKKKWVNIVFNSGNYSNMKRGGCSQARREDEKYFAKKKNG